MWARYYLLHRTLPTVRHYPGQSRQAIIFRLAALFPPGSNELTFDRDYDDENSLFDGACMKTRKQARTKARLRTKKPLCVRYAEVMRLRQAIIEAQSAKPTREEPPAPK